jgi:TPR repeat protein
MKSVRLFSRFVRKYNKVIDAVALYKEQKWDDALKIFQSFSDHDSLCYSGKILSRQAKYDEALICFQKAHSLGNIEAATNIGFFYENAYGGLEQNFEKAFEFYKLASTKGDDRATTYLGLFYMGGIHVPADSQLGEKLLREASEKGNPEAMTYLGIYYASEDRVPEAIDLFKKALQVGFGEAAYQMGKLYEDGNGVDQDDTIALTKMDGV